MTGIIVGVIVVLVAIIWVIHVIVLYKKGSSAKRVVEDTMVNKVFSAAAKTQSVIRSKYFPDKLYVGKALRLDRSLRVMYPNALFGFPSDLLIVKGFQYFDIDGNPFEEIIFDKLGEQDYIALYDKFEDTVYFLNRLMSQPVADNEMPAMASQDTITLSENGELFEYIDMSGLIKVQVTDQLHPRMIRVYTREVAHEEHEYLICISDDPSVVHYYIGFNISLLQLENI